MIAAEPADVVLAAEPAQHHDCLPERGQGPAAGGRAAPPALCPQQLGNVLNQCAGDVERGTMSNHVELSGRLSVLWRELFCRGLYVYFRPSTTSPESPGTPP